MLCHMKIKVSLRYFGMIVEEQLKIKYYEIEHLTLLKIQNMMDVKEVLHEWITNFLIKRLQLVLLEVKLC